MKKCFLQQVPIRFNYVQLCFKRIPCFGFCTYSISFRTSLSPSLVLLGTILSLYAGLQKLSLFSLPFPLENLLCPLLHPPSASPFGDYNLSLFLPRHFHPLLYHYNNYKCTLCAYILIRRHNIIYNYIQ